MKKANWLVLTVLSCLLSSGAGAVDWNNPQLDIKEAPPSVTPAPAKPAGLQWVQADTKAASDVIDITAENYDKEVKNSKLPVFLDFYATWCGPCKLIAPKIEELAAQFKGKVKFGRVDVDQQRKLTEEAKVEAMPTFILIKNGAEVKRFVGVDRTDLDATKKRFEDAIKTYLLAP